MESISWASGTYANEKNQFQVKQNKNITIITAYKLSII